MNRRKNCYTSCIDKKFLIDAEMLRKAEEIVFKDSEKSKSGRPPLEFKTALNGIYYLLRTGIQWNALPRCFGSSSAVHRTFQTLVNSGFFKTMWIAELLEYDATVGLNLGSQSLDCSHVKSPMGKEKVGNSPVDRRKHGTKRSIVVEENGIAIGCFLGSGNQHDSKLFLDTISSIPQELKRPVWKEMHLDSAYDSTAVRTILFNLYYVPRISKNRRHSKVTSPSHKGTKKRWVVERSHSWMNRFRRLFVKYEKHASNYLGLMLFSLSITIFNKLGI